MPLVPGSNSHDRHGFKLYYVSAALASKGNRANSPFGSRRIMSHFTIKFKRAVFDLKYQSPCIFEASLDLTSSESRKDDELSPLRSHRLRTLWQPLFGAQDVFAIYSTLASCAFLNINIKRPLSNRVVRICPNTF